MLSLSCWADWHCWLADCGASLYFYSLSKIVRQVKNILATGLFRIFKGNNFNPLQAGKIGNKFKKKFFADQFQM